MIVVDRGLDRILRRQFYLNYFYKIRLYLMGYVVSPPSVSNVRRVEKWCHVRSDVCSLHRRLMYF